MGQLSLKASRIVKPIDLISCSNVHLKFAKWQLSMMTLQIKANLFPGGEFRKNKSLCHSMLF